MSGFLSIADAAEAVGLSAHTLRYYERIGLIPPVGRRGGARRYANDDMRWLEFLVRLRGTGMSVVEMRRYAELRRSGDTMDSVGERRALLEKHAARLEAEMGALGETLAYLNDKIRRYAEIQASAEPV